MSGVGTFIVVLTATTAVGRDCLMFIRSLIFNLGIKIKDLTPDPVYAKQLNLSRLLAPER